MTSPGDVNKKKNKKLSDDISIGGVGSAESSLGSNVSRGGIGRANVVFEGGGGGHNNSLRPTQSRKRRLHEEMDPCVHQTRNNKPVKQSTGNRSKGRGGGGGYHSGGRHGGESGADECLEQEQGRHYNNHRHQSRGGKKYDDVEECEPSGHGGNQHYQSRGKYGHKYDQEVCPEDRGHHTGGHHHHNNHYEDDEDCGNVRGSFGNHELCESGGQQYNYRPMEEAGRYHYLNSQPPIQLFCTPVSPKHGHYAGSPLCKNVRDDPCDQRSATSVHVLYCNTNGDGNDGSRQQKTSRGNGHGKHGGNKHGKRNSSDSERENRGSQTKDNEDCGNPQCSNMEMERYDPQGQSRADGTPAGTGTTSVKVTVAVSSGGPPASNPMEPPQEIESEYLEPPLTNEGDDNNVIVVKSNIWQTVEDDDAAVLGNSRSVQAELPKKEKSTLSVNVGVSSGMIRSKSNEAGGTNSMETGQQQSGRGVTFAPSVPPPSSCTGSGIGKGTNTGPITVNVTISSGQFPESNNSEDIYGGDFGGVGTGTQTSKKCVVQDDSYYSRRGGPEMETKAVAPAPVSVSVNVATYTAPDQVTAATTMSTNNQIRFQDEEEECGDGFVNTNSSEMQLVAGRTQSAPAFSTGPPRKVACRPKGALKTGGPSSTAINVNVEVGTTTSRGDLHQESPVAGVQSSTAIQVDVVNTEASSRLPPPALKQNYGSSTQLGKVQSSVKIGMSGENPQDRTTTVDVAVSAAPLGVQFAPPPSEGRMVSTIPPGRSAIGPQRRRSSGGSGGSGGLGGGGGGCSDLISELADLLWEQKKVLQTYQRMSCCFYPPPCQPPSCCCCCCCGGCSSGRNRRCCTPMPFWGAGGIPPTCCSNYEDDDESSSGSESKCSEDEEGEGGDEGEVQEDLQLALDIKQNPEYYGIGGVGGSHNRNGGGGGGTVAKSNLSKGRGGNKANVKSGLPRGATSQVEITVEVTPP